MRSKQKLIKERGPSIAYISINLRMPIYYYIAAFVIFVVLILSTRKPPLSLLLSYCFLILAATVFSRRVSGTAKLELMPFWSYKKAIVGHGLRNEILANILMFVPVGALLPMVVKRPVLIGMGLSVFIELLQLLTHRGLCETDDVISNTIGLLLGIGLLQLGKILARKIRDILLF